MAEKKTELSGYETPGPEELRQFMAENNLDALDLAMLTGASPRTARAWMTDKKTALPIPWSAWAALRMLTGNASRDELLAKIDSWKRERTGRGLFERGKAGRPAGSGKSG